MNISSVTLPQNTSSGLGKMAGCWQTLESRSLHLCLGLVFSGQAGLAVSGGRAGD